MYYYKSKKNFVYSLLHIWLITYQTIGIAFAAFILFEFNSAHLAMSSTLKSSEQLQNEKIRIGIAKEISEIEKNKTDRQKVNSEIEKIKTETEQMKNLWHFIFQSVIPSLAVPVTAIMAILAWRKQIEENKLARVKLEHDEEENRKKLNNENDEKLEEMFMDAVKSLSISSLSTEIVSLSSLSYLIRHEEFHERIYDLLFNRLRVNSENKEKTSFSLLRFFEKALQVRLKNIGTDGTDSRRSSLSFSELTLDEIKFFNIDLTDSNFRKTSLRNAEFTGLPELKESTFQEATLEESKFLNVDFIDVNLISAKFNAAKINCVNFDFGFPNQKKQQLQEAHFIKATLEKVNFNNCNLTGVMFKNAAIEGGTFNNCTLSKTSFQSATLNGTRFMSSCVLSEVNFEYACFNGVIFDEKVIFKTGSKLNNTQFINTEFNGVSISNLNFSNSTFDHKTLESIAKLINWHEATFAQNHMDTISELVKKNPQNSAALPQSIDG